MSQARIVIIDDKENYLEKLGNQLGELSSMKNVDVERWVPTSGEEENPLPKFDRIINECEPILVVTDYDLTEGGHSGLFGPTITRWCHKELIPVVEFSRNFNKELPKRPNLFKLRAPEEESKMPDFISAITEGFIKLNDLVKHKKSIRSSYTDVLYRVLGEENCLEYEITDYLSHLFKNVEFLYEKISDSGEIEFDLPKTKRILTYILGHVIVNSFFRFPGPIIAKRALCAYVAVHYDESDKLKEFFECAKYDGPFNNLGEYYWKLKVDAKIQKAVDDLIENSNGNGSIDEILNKGITALNKSAIEFKIGALKSHVCKHGCEGEKGGFYCPYTSETVCEREDCSVSSSSWIPYGGNICRVERDYFDRWKPFLTN